MAKLLIENARLAFPALLEVSERTGKYGCALLLEKDNPACAKIEEMAVSLVTEGDKKNADSIIKRAKQVDKWPLHDGNAKEKYAGYADHLFVNASCPSKPKLRDRNPKELITDEEDIRSKFYSGARVNAVVELFWYNNKFGKGVGCSLAGLQFVSDDDRFSGGAPATDDDFPVVEGDTAEETQPWA